MIKENFKTEMSGYQDQYNIKLNPFQCYKNNLRDAGIREISLFVGCYFHFMCG